MVQEQQRLLALRVAVRREPLLKEHPEGAVRHVDHPRRIDHVQVVTAADGRELLPVERNETPLFSEAVGGGDQ